MNKFAQMNQLVRLLRSYNILYRLSFLRNYPTRLNTRSCSGIELLQVSSSFRNYSIGKRKAEIFFSRAKYLDFLDGDIGLFTKVVYRVVRLNESHEF